MPRYHQIGKSNVDIDRMVSAQLPGKRISHNKKEYYEYRKNRSDMPNSRV